MYTWCTLKYYSYVCITKAANCYEQLTAELNKPSKIYLMETKLNNPKHLFQIIYHTLKQSTIRVAFENAPDIEISRTDFEAFLFRHDKVKFDSLTYYWAHQVDNQRQDIYEYLLIKKGSAPKMFAGIYNQIQTILSNSNLTPAL